MRVMYLENLIFVELRFKTRMMMQRENKCTSQTSHAPRLLQSESKKKLSNFTTTTTVTVTACKI